MHWLCYLLLVPPCSQLVSHIIEETSEVEAAVIHLHATSTYSGCVREIGEREDRERVERGREREGGRREWGGERG